MSKEQPIYTPEFCQQIVELVRADRKPYDFIKGYGLVCQQRRDVHVIYTLMQANQAEFATRMMAHVLKVSSSGFYGWVDRPLSPRAQANVALMNKIREVHK